MPSFAHFDADSPLTAGLCVSSFLVSIDEDGLLMGRMQNPEAWRGLEPVQSPKHSMGPTRWVLPAAHLHLGEHPEEAAKRIAEEQLHASLGDLLLSRVLSYTYPIPSRDQDLHWDLCFVFDAELSVAETPAWFAELRCIPLSEVHHHMFARGHGDVLVDLNLVDSPSDRSR